MIILKGTKYLFSHITFKLFCAAQGCLQSNTTTLSALAGINPRTKTFLTPQL